MYFTQGDFKKIEAWLLQNTIKDTQFNKALLPLTGRETVAFVQNGHNVKASLKDIIDQIFLLGVSDFLNITDKYGQKGITLDQAIRLIPFRSRKIGQVITFLNNENDWVMYQFQGSNITNWDSLSLWVNVISGGGGGGSDVIPDGEDTTGVKSGDKTLIKFANKAYNPAIFSGYGRVFLRKNIVTVPGGGAINMINSAMFTQSSTIYIIQYDYDAQGGTLILPQDIILMFEGGSIKNAKLNPIAGCVISSPPVKIFDNVTLNTRITNDKVYAEWFGAIGDNNADRSSANSIAFNQAINFVKESLNRTVVVGEGNFWIGTNIDIPSNISFGGEGPVPTCLKSDEGNIVLRLIGTEGIEKVNLHDLILEGGRGNTPYTFGAITCTAPFIRYCTFRNISTRGGNAGFNLSLSGEEGMHDNVFEDIKSPGPDSIPMYDIFHNYGMSINAGSGVAARFENNVFNRCRFAHNLRGGIVCRGFTMNKSNYFNNCTFEDNGGKDATTTAGFAVSASGGGPGALVFDGCIFNKNVAQAAITTVTSMDAYATGEIGEILTLDAAIEVVNSTFISPAAIIIQKNSGSVIFQNNAISDGPLGSMYQPPCIVVLNNTVEGLNSPRIKIHDTNHFTRITTPVMEFNPLETKGVMYDFNTEFGSLHYNAKKLLSPATIYVHPTYGDDKFTGLSPLCPRQTLGIPEFETEFPVTFRIIAPYTIGVNTVVDLSNLADATIITTSLSPSDSLTIQDDATTSGTAGLLKGNNITILDSNLNLTSYETVSFDAIRAKNLFIRDSKVSLSQGPANGSINLYGLYNEENVTVTKVTDNVFIKFTAEWNMLGGEVRNVDGTYKTRVTIL